MAKFRVFRDNFQINVQKSIEKIKKASSCMEATHQQILDDVSTEFIPKDIIDHIGKTIDSD